MLLCGTKYKYKEMTNLRVVNYSEKNAGKTLKFTKKLYTWELFLDDKPVLVQFFRSKVTSKKKVLVNSEVRFKGKYSGGTFQCLFHIGDHTLVVIQQGKMYDLRIDSLSFAHLWLREKTQREFVYDEPQVAEEPARTNAGLSPPKLSRIEEEKSEKIVGFTINPAKSAGSGEVPTLSLGKPPQASVPKLKAPGESSPSVQASPNFNILDLPPAAKPVPATPPLNLLDDFWSPSDAPSESPSNKLLM